MPENQTAPKQIFNLLKPAKPIIPTWDKIYYWLSGTIRILILFVEVIIIAGFAYRVIIDRQSNDIKDQVSQDEKILNIYKSREITYRNYQANLNELTKTVSGANSFINPINQLILQFPKTAVSSISFQSDGSFTLTATTSKDIVTQFEQLLKNSKITKNVTITNYVVKDDGSVSYSMQGQVIFTQR